MSNRPLLPAIVGVLVLAAAVAVATALTVSGDGTDPHCTDQAYGCAEFLPGEPVRLGLLATLSGPGRERGREARRGTALAIEAHGGRLAGRPIELLAEDDACSTVGAAEGARELASDPPFEPPVVAVVGMPCPAGLQAAAQILSDSGVALLTATPGRVVFTDPPRSFLARPPVGRPDRRFRRLYEARYGDGPSDASAWVAYSLTRRVLTAAEGLATSGSDSSLLVPRSALLRALGAR